MNKTWQTIVVVALALAAGFMVSQGVKSCDGPETVSDLEKKVILFNERFDVLERKDSIKDVKILKLDKNDSALYRTININHQSDKNEKAQNHAVPVDKLQAYTDSVLLSDKNMR